MRKIHLLLILVALSLATSSLKALPTNVDDGKLPGKFSASPTKIIYFSQGNLQYLATADGTGTDLTHKVAGGGTAQGVWRFAEEQFHYVGGGSCSCGNVYIGDTKCDNDNPSSTKTTWSDLFCWATSGWPRDEHLSYQPWATSGTFGVTYPTTTSEVLSGDYANGDWGVYNAISNGGDEAGIWRLLTSTEWDYIIKTRATGKTVNSTNNARYTVAQINTDGTAVKGLILFPDNFEGPYTSTSDITWGTINAYSDYTTTCTTAGWLELENAGCVFLPFTYRRSSTYTMNFNAGNGYWTSNVQTQTYFAIFFCFFSAEGVRTQNQYRSVGYAVRLVSETAPKYPSSISVLPEAVDPSIFDYDGIEHTLLSNGGTAEGGTMMYKINDGEWSSELPKATNAGTYTIYYMVQGDATHKDYTPEPNTITVTINKVDIDVSGLSVTGNSLYANGSPQELVSVSGSVTGGTLKYSTDGISWSTDIPTESEVGTYTVYYMVEGDANHNDYTPIPAYITVSIDDYPFVADNEDPTSKLEDFSDDGSMNLQVKRTIYADDEYNTICLPFALDESALAASPLAGFNRLKTFKGAQVTGTAPDLYIDIFVEDATTIEAGIPYLITYPSAHADIVNPVFNGITVTTTEPSAVSVDGITFQGMFAQVHIDPYTSSARDEDYLFLGANSQLYWPSSDQTSSSIKMRGFRAYFIIDRNSITPALAPKGTRARIMEAPKTTTAIDNTSAKFGGSEKIIENGILYIIRNGVKYNAQGQIVK